MRNIIYIILLAFFSATAFAQKKIIVHFENYANGKPIVLNDSVYKTNSGESYTINKLKYYVSDIHFVTTKHKRYESNVFLEDASENDSIALELIGEPLVGISFMLGVDSALNCSGAQEGALDPLNDMFWTWNNGYVMFKLEGTSDSSKADQHRIEHHIGGYKGKFKTMRRVFLPYKPKSRQGLSAITICMNLDKYWQSGKSGKQLIAPIITQPGELASLQADQFPMIFSIKE